MKSFIVLLVGCIIGFGVGFFYPGQVSSSSSETAEKQPLYWVAPMDPNYKRDQPGKSPMGMDLIPVYEESGSGSKEVGTITVASNVINTLGVRTAKVEKKSLNALVTSVGYVEYDQDAIVHVHPRVEGWVEQLHVRAEGDFVEKNQPLYTLYSPQLVSAQEEYLLALNRNNPRLIQASEERLKALGLNQSFIRRLAGQGQVLQTITYYAPQSGVIQQLNAREGFFLKPGTNIMTIANLGQVWVEASIIQQQAHLIEKGLPVMVEIDAAQNKQRSSVVDYIYPSVDPQTRTTRVRIRLDNQDGSLKPGMFVHVHIQGASEEPMLVVPREAVIRTGYQNRVVLAMGDGQFKSIAVGIGRQIGDWVQIAEGLNENEEVVVSAQFLLDSESSKTSDFKRMEPVTVPDQVWVEAKVEDLMGTSMIKLTHQPIEVWDWPVMTMMFMVDENLDISQLKPGISFHAQIHKTEDNEYILVGLHVPDGDAMDMNSDEINHEGMNHD